MDKNYIARMREKVGHEGMIFVTSFGVLWNEKHDSILLEGRWDTDAGWGFPGGYLEYGDTPEEGVVREFKEETNLDVEVVRLLGVTTNIVEKNNWGDTQETIGFCFEVKKIGGIEKKDGVETLDLQYVPVDPVPTMFNKRAQTSLDTILKQKSNDQPWFKTNRYRS